MTRVNYLGLNMDALIVPKIVTALRGLYPNLVTPADSDNRAVQLVLQHIITEHLTEWARRSATAPLDQVVRDATDTALGQQAVAADIARTDASDVLPTAVT